MAAAIVGPPARVRDELLRLVGLGIDTLVLQVRADRAPGEYRDAMRVLAGHVLPTLRDVTVQGVA
jgi:hypothetical protein